MPTKTKILIADDHVIIRRGLKFLLDARFPHCRVMETDNTRDLLKMLSENAFSHLILDMQLLDANAMDVFPKIHHEYPNLQILIFTMSAEEIYGKRMMQMGADGFISKQSDENEVIRALDLFMSGKKYMSPSLNDMLLHELKGKETHKNPFHVLSEREMVVMNYLLNGEGVKEIASRLDLKATTIATFKARVFQKLGVSNIIDLRKLSETYADKNNQD